MSARYSWGGDEFVFVELAEDMSLQANFKAVAITNLLRSERPDGILEICPANASYQVRYDPDVLDPHALMAQLTELETRVGDALGVTLDCRVVEIPVLYQDPWTTETLMRFRDRHQDPEATVLSFAMTMVQRPCTSQKAVTTPAPGACNLPKTRSWFTNVPTSNRRECGSRKSSMRSRAVSLPLA